MTLESWIWTAYGVVAILLLIPTARFCLAEMTADTDDVEPFELAMSAMLALCIVPFWPLFIPGWWIYRVLALDTRDKRGGRR